MFRRNHGRSLTALRRYPEAERELLAAHSVLLAELGPEDRETQSVVRRLTELYEAWERPAALAAWRAKLKPAS